MTDLCAIRLSVVSGLGSERKNSWAPGPITLLGAKVTEGGALVSVRLQFFVRCAAGPGDEAERAEGAAGRLGKRTLWGTHGSGA